MKDVLAVVGAIATLLAAMPYLVDIILGKTKPNIVSWLTWTLLTGIGAAAAFAAGEWQAGVQTFAVMVWVMSVVLLGLRYGIAKFTKFDGFCQTGAFLGVALWLALDSPAAAIVVVVMADFIGALPTLRHAWKSPHEETWQTFVYALAGPIMTITSLSVVTLEGLLYPLYFVFINAVIAGVVVYRRQMLGISLHRHGIHEVLHE